MLDLAGYARICARSGFMELICSSRPGCPRGSQAREIFRKFRTPGEGEKLILEGNAFVERVLPGGMRHKLTDEEMAVYRAPFPTPQSRRPTWRFPNELPIAGEPADVYATMERAHAALVASTYPKLLFAAEPGGLVPLAFAQELAGKLKDCRFVKLGDGIHFLQEDHPETIGDRCRLDCRSRRPQRQERGVSGPAVAWGTDTAPLSYGEKGWG